MLNNYTWGVDGKGRAHICKADSIVILCMLDGFSGQVGVWILEDQ